MSQTASVRQYLQQMNRYTDRNLCGLVHTLQQSLKFTIDSSEIQTWNSFISERICYQSDSSSVLMQTSSFFSSLMRKDLSSSSRLPLGVLIRWSDSSREGGMYCIILASILGVSSIRHIYWKQLSSELRLETDSDSFLLFLQLNLFVKILLSQPSALLLQSMNLCMQLLRLRSRFLVLVKRGFYCSGSMGQQYLQSGLSELRGSGQLFYDSYFFMPQ